MQLVKVEVFSSPSCGKCGHAKEVLRKLAQDIGGIEWRDVNVLEEMGYAVSLGVLSTPAIAIGGELVFSGLPSVAVCLHWTDRHQHPCRRTPTHALRHADSDAQRRAFPQIAKVLEDIGPRNVKIEVVAYEAGITSLLLDNNDTAILLAALARAGVRFKACRISMRGHGYTDAGFPLEVEFVPAGAPEMVRLQMEGYRYCRL